MSACICQNLQSLQRRAKGNGQLFVGTHPRGRFHEHCEDMPTPTEMDSRKMQKTIADRYVFALTKKLTMKLTHISLWLGAWLLGPVLSVQAALPGDAGLFDAVTVYGGQGVDHNLRQIPEAILSNNLDRDKSYFVGVGLAKTGPKLGLSVDRLQGTPLAELRQNFELLLLKHHGLQHNAELGAAYLLRTPDLQMGPLGVNLAAGTGLSYAIGKPTYEDGPKDDLERRYRLQLLLLFELEWKLRNVDGLSLATRIHHRSGAYGLIAPPHVGSNFITVGLRYRF
jgi:hypothetical protein